MPLKVVIHVPHREDGTPAFPGPGPEGAPYVIARSRERSDAELYAANLRRALHDAMAGSGRPIPIVTVEPVNRGEDE